MLEMQFDFDGLIEVVANHLYSEKKVFIRELIQNAHDGIRRRAQAGAGWGRIDIETRPQDLEITIRDNGIGMNRDDLIGYLSNVGKSFTRLQRESTEGLIGQFGIGFLSAFVVAQRVEVRTRKLDEAQGWLWENDGKKTYELTPCDVDAPGTSVRVILKNPEDRGIIQETEVRDLIRKYADMLSVPIYLNGGREPENTMRMPWEKAGLTSSELDWLHTIPEGAAPVSVYSVKYAYFNYLLIRDGNPSIDKIVASADEADAVCRSIGWSDSRDIPHRRGEIFNQRGMRQEALTQFEVAWSRTAASLLPQHSVAYDAALTLLRLGQPAEARRWLTHIVSSVQPHTAKIIYAYVRLCIALHDNDAPACKGATLGLDDAMSGTEWITLTAERIYATVAAVILDQDLGDPVAPAHPGTIRLAEFPKNQQGRYNVAELQHQTTIIQLIAGLRYAAGVAPVDDIYYRKPQQLRPRSAARLPEEIPTRVATARKACDDALPLAIHLDTGFQCTFRQDEVLSRRARVDEIAAIYGL